MKIVVCDACGVLAVLGIATVPGTQSRRTWNCDHRLSQTIGTVDGRALIHAALSTLMRLDVLGPAERNHAHVLQEWIRAPRDARRTWPSVLIDGYDVSSYGLSAARLIAAEFARGAQGSDAVRWRSAATIMRRKLA